MSLQGAGTGARRGIEQGGQHGESTDAADEHGAIVDAVFGNAGHHGRPLQDSVEMMQHPHLASECRQEGSNCARSVPSGTTVVKSAPAVKTHRAIISAR